MGEDVKVLRTGERGGGGRKEEVKGIMTRKRGKEENGEGRRVWDESIERGKQQGGGRGWLFFS